MDKLRNKKETVKDKKKKKIWRVKRFPNLETDIKVYEQWMKKWLPFYLQHISPRLTDL